MRKQLLHVVQERHPTAQADTPGMQKKARSPRLPPRVTAATKRRCHCGEGNFGGFALEYSIEVEYFCMKVLVPSGPHSTKHKRI